MGPERLCVKMLRPEGEERSRGDAVRRAWLTVYLSDGVIVTVRVHPAEARLARASCGTVESSAKEGRRSRRVGTAMVRASWSLRQVLDGKQANEDVRLRMIAA